MTKIIFMQYGLAEAKTRLSELTHLVDAGQEVVIAKHGRPGYRLVALSASLPVHVQPSAGNEMLPPPSSLDDMSEVLANLRSKSRMPKEENFVAQLRQVERY